MPADKSPLFSHVAQRRHPTLLRLSLTGAPSIILSRLLHPPIHLQKLRRLEHFKGWTLNAPLVLSHAKTTASPVFLDDAALTNNPPVHTGQGLVRPTNHQLSLGPGWPSAFPRPQQKLQNHIAFLREDICERVAYPISKRTDVVAASIGRAAFSADHIVAKFLVQTAPPNPTITMEYNPRHDDVPRTIEAVSYLASGNDLVSKGPLADQSAPVEADGQSVPKTSSSQPSHEGQVTPETQLSEISQTTKAMPAASNFMATVLGTTLPETTYSEQKSQNESAVKTHDEHPPSETQPSKPTQNTLPPIKTQEGGSSYQDADKNLPSAHDQLAYSPGSEWKPGHKRLESMVVTPLTHPNGVSIFPDLSTAQQDEISREALFEAEDTIVADSEDVSTIGDGTSDAGYESDSVSSGSTSMQSSIRDYMYENGRRYHRFREGAYNFPNDDVEQEREDMKHAMIKLLCNQKLHFAPIGQHPQDILDIGTGTGIWAIEMGDQFSSANILGIDLSPIQPDWLPPNVRFMVDDVESPWLHPRNHFDYIHTRHTVMGIKDWDRLFRRAIEHLKPGGWFEMQEIHHKPHGAARNSTIPPEHPVAKYWQLVTDGLGALGVNFHAAAGGNLANKMRDAGFVNVTERVFHVPLGTWPKNKVLKTVGLYWRTILMDGMQAIALGPLTRGLRWNPEQVELLLVDVRKAYLNNNILMYMPCHIVYGQKPEYL